MRPRKFPNQNGAVSNQLVDGGKGGDVLGLKVKEGKYVLTDSNGYKQKDFKKR
jgi:hypothetical protein